MNCNVNTLLSALNIFRDAIKNGSRGTDLHEVFMTLTAYCLDSKNELFLYTDAADRIMTVNDDLGKKTAFVFTSPEELIDGTYEGKDLDFVYDSAYEIFKDLSDREDIGGAFINNGTKPAVYLPKDIIRMIVDGCDILENCNGVYDQADMKTAGSARPEIPDRLFIDMVIDQSKPGHKKGWVSTDDDYD